MEQPKTTEASTAVPESSKRGQLFLFGTPGDVGGAATKIRHLLILLHQEYEITVVLSHVSFLKEKKRTKFLDSLGIKYAMLKDLPDNLEGVALAICELEFFASQAAHEVKKRGLKLVWSNEMMWAFRGEAEAVKQGLVDRVHFVSDVQQTVFAKMYENVPSFLTGNYVLPDEFPFVERNNERFTIGRLSRPDLAKYPEDFPVFYEELGLAPVRYSVMAWSDELRKKYRWHRFGSEWQLYPANKIVTAKFLQELDLFVYPLGHKFVESWGRSTVEAMLTGCIPLVQTGHQFHNLIVHEETGFICKDFKEFRYYANELYRDSSRRRAMSEACAKHARMHLCNAVEHKQQWIEALSF